MLQNAFSDMIQEAVRLIMKVMPHFLSKRDFYDPFFLFQFLQDLLYI
jgi:hypothetical protein